MVRHYCDACGKEVNDATGIVGQRETTIELGTPGSKVSLLSEVGTMTRGRDLQGESALCLYCLKNRVDELVRDLDEPC